MAGGLSGRVAIVTGASAGIGWATAEALARDGAAVVVQARRGGRLNELVEAIERRGGKGLAVAGDAVKVEDTERLLAEAKAFAKTVGGRLDLVVVNAGRGLAGGLLSSDESKWEEMYQLNVLGAAALMRRAGQMMVDQGGGDIVVMGSISGHSISPFSGFYGGSKFAVAAMAEAFRREACAKGVRVTVLKPGVVISEFQESAGYTKENFFKTAEKYGKLMSPADVAEVIRYAVSLPPHVSLNEIVIRPTGQDYP